MFPEVHVLTLLLLLILMPATILNWIIELTSHLLSGTRNVSERYDLKTQWDHSWVQKFMISKWNKIPKEKYSLNYVLEFKTICINLPEIGVTL